VLGVLPKPLSEVAVAEDEILLEGFEATVRGDRVTITAVLERTCVCLMADGERRLINKRLLLVEPSDLVIRRKRHGPP
jgi:hypothetical protein